MYTTQGISGIPGILKYDTFKGFFKVEGKDKLVSGGRYRPFTLIMFALEWQLFKKQKLTETGQVAKDANGGALSAAYYSLMAFYKKSNSLEIAVFVCFFIALMSKENAITFLGVVPLMYWFFTDAKIGTIVKKSVFLR